MKKINRWIFCFLTTIAIGFSASAQTLPAIQQISLKAPANIEIDGKTTEWNNKFQAFNHNIDAYYTIANDDDNLFLIVQAKDEAIVKKVIGGGIVLSISNTKKKFNQSVIVGSPLISEAGQLSVSSRFMRFKEYAGNRAHAKETDSLLLIANKELTIQSKQIALVGIKEIDNNVISVYNDFGIKTTLLFDRTGALNYELAIPLKYLQRIINNQPGFFYDLMIKGMANQAKAVKSKTGEAATVTDMPMDMTPGKSSDMELLMNNTDFWGEYKLAK